jgi:hypothetical protein
MQLICLLGSGARAISIVVDLDKITKSKEITVPTADAIWECLKINELKTWRIATTSPPQHEPSTDQRSKGTEHNRKRRRKQQKLITNPRY